MFEYVASKKIRWPVYVLAAAIGFAGGFIAAKNRYQTEVAEVLQPQGQTESDPKRKIIRDMEYANSEAFRRTLDRNGIWTDKDLKPGENKWGYEVGDFAVEHVVKLKRKPQKASK